MAFRQGFLCFLTENVGYDTMQEKEAVGMKLQRLDHKKVLKLLPERNKEAHKGDFGRVLLLCGSVGYTGAAALAAMGALRSGAGLVYLGVPESIYAIEAGKLDEAIVFPLPEEKGKLSEAAVAQLYEKLPQMDAVLIGPGLGQSAGVLAVVRTVLETGKCPVIVDADGIDVLAKHKDILRERHHCTILTPHAGEFLRLWPKGCGDREIDAMDLARDTGTIVLLKGHHTLITDGTVCYENTTGNPGMATGGSGDVLAGIITSLVGQGIEPLQAAACGAWLHGRAGDLCAKSLGMYGMLPSDMLMVLPRLMK